MKPYKFTVEVRDPLTNKKVIISGVGTSKKNANEALKNKAGAFEEVFWKTKARVW